ncbi:MAG: Rne/Rng family ribonuclease [Myxococcota bacterium]
MPSRLLVINADGPETRVALVEGGILAELYVERHSGRGIVGNVYKGRVRRVLPGLQAAFVDIGADKDGYLHASDVRGGADDMSKLLVDEEEGREEEDERPARAPIQELVREGQEVLVQVTKEPLGTKGSRLTTYITLPGRHLVFMPTVEHTGISRRIASDKERRRLRDILESKRPPGTGFVVRTVAEGVPAEVLHDDIDYLVRLWNQKVAKAETMKAPACVYWDLDLALRALRDLVTTDVEKIIVDSRVEHERMLKFAATFMPHQNWRIDHYDGSEPIFDAYGIEDEIGRALQRKVWLKSGGYLLIDQLEAFTAIDVNTGKFVGKRNLEDTITKTNLEAVKEVVDQIRLRNLGGIVVIDFIDMDRRENRAKVSRALDEALRADRAKVNVLKISEFGLVEMTRKRVRESLGRSLTEACPYCEGRGTVRSKLTVCNDALRDIRRRADTLTGDTIVILAHPEVARIVEEEQRPFVEEIEKRMGKKIVVRAMEKFHLEQYEVRGE